MKATSRTHTREEYIIIAKLCNRCDKYEDMITCAKAIIELDPHLSEEEKIILCTGYKNLVNAKRASLKKIKEIEQNEKKRNSSHAKYICEIIEPIEEEIKQVCLDFTSLLENKLIPKSRNKEEIVYWMKLQGDYFRYICEFSEKDQLSQYSSAASKAYQQAMAISSKYHSLYSKLRLELILSIAIFTYEIMNNRDEAIQLARSTLKETKCIRDELTKSHAVEYLNVLRLLKDNMITWSALNCEEFPDIDNE